MLIIPEKICLETPRLLLKKPNLADIAVMSTILNDLKTMQYLNYVTQTGKEWDHQKTQARIEQQLAQQAINRALLFHLFLKKEAELIGVSGFPIIDPENKTAVFGIFLNHPFWHQNLATEAHLFALQYGFEMLELESVSFFTMAENKPMRRFFDKFNIPEQTKNSNASYNSHPATTGDCMYTLTATAWPTTQTKLQAALNS